MVRPWLCLFLVACFDPAPPAGAPCGADGSCPRGLVCIVGTCEVDRPADAPVISVDAPGLDAPRPDAPAIDAPPMMHTIPAGAALWLATDDDPVDGAADSAGTHATTCTSCPALVAGRIASAYLFTTDRLLVAATADLQPGQAFTIAAWVRVDVTPTTNVVVACKNTGTLDCSYALLVSSTRQPVYYSSGSSLTTGATAMALGTWHHLALTWDGATKRGYYDGVPDVSAAIATIASDAAMPLSIGERNATSALSFGGAIDDVVFYNRVLTPTEIAQLANP